jgi:putative ABC transport system permease protein
MLKFLAKGLLRDPSRSLLPALIIASGAFLTVISHCWIVGAFGGIIDSNANFSTGHVKVMTRAYEEISDQIPNDLVILGLEKEIKRLNSIYPNMFWIPRIKFGGLLDVPDKNNETRAQGPVFGMGIDLLSANSKEFELLNLKEGIIQGHIPSKPNEILISDDYAKKINLKIGDRVTLLSSTMDGSMAVYNFFVAGTIKFGIAAMDRGAFIADIKDIQLALNMIDGSGEILGFFNNRYFDNKKAKALAKEFNQKYSDEHNPFSPIMRTLGQQNGLDAMLNLSSWMAFLLLSIFVSAMSLVLWNSGLMASLRRYGEIGVRLAVGESKRNVYLTMILESLIIGVAGSILGTILGLALAFYLQEVGLDITTMFRGSSTIMNNVMRAKIVPLSFYIGFIPGLFASVLGTMFAGIGIFKRQTAQLFKELEVG